MPRVQRTNPEAQRLVEPARCAAGIGGTCRALFGWQGGSPLPRRRGEGVTDSALLYPLRSCSSKAAASLSAHEESGFDSSFGGPMVASCFRSKQSPCC